jgi:bacteriorhodopsin
MKDLLIDKTSEDDNIIEHKVKFSFNITYILLLTTATITFIEAIRTQNPIIRHILNIETAISVIAGYFYSAFVNKISESYDKNKKIDWRDINRTRYMDWFITTPLMLLVLCLVLSSQINKNIKLYIIVIIVLLNYSMIYVGYLGETDSLNKNIAAIIGFIFFALMYFIIYYNYILPKYNLANYSLFMFYLVIWSIYGIVYLLDEEKKNIGFNILDLIAKCFVGIGLWIFYTKIVVLK